MTASHVFQAQQEIMRNPTESIGHALISIAQTLEADKIRFSVTELDAVKSAAMALNGFGRGSITEALIPVIDKIERLL